MTPRGRVIWALLAFLACAFFFPTRSLENATAVSTDGEGTVYLAGDFSSDFDLAYRVALEPSPKNASLTFVGIMLLGNVNPGPGVSIGLSRGGLKGDTLKAYTSVTYPKNSGGYKSLAVRCRASCELRLYGDVRNIYASIEGKNAGRWSRSDLQLVNPYIQLNAEVTKPGDALSASLVAIRAVAGSRALSVRPCAFTTQGIVPRLDGHALVFSGTYRSGASASFIALANGQHAVCK